MKKPELLAPAGDLEKLKIAIMYGADAVFIGGQEYGLRANASNFTLDEIKLGCEFAHENNAKVYVTTNIFFHNENIAGFIEYVKSLEMCGVDGLIAADLYAVKVIQEHTNMEVHLSTQQSVLNSKAVSLFKKLGVTRIVLARECNKDQIESIVNKSEIEIEVFIHGSMCIGYSGRCMLSNHMTARDANRGGCSQNCRWEYDLVDLNENFLSKTHGKFSMNPDDLTLVKYIKELCELGIDCLKIEGRMRSIYYIANTVKTYREIIDNYFDSKQVDEKYALHELNKSANRHISEQYFNGLPAHTQQNFGGRDEKPSKDFCLLVKGYDKEKSLLIVEQRNYFTVGEEIEFIIPKQKNLVINIDLMYNSEMISIDVARHPQEIIYIPLDEEIPVFSMGRKLRK